MTLNLPLLPFLLITGISSPGFALHPASEESRAEISRFISDAKEKQADIATTEAKQKRAEFKGDREDIRFYNEQIKELEREKKLLYQKALRKTLVAYDIVESQDDGRPFMPRMKENLFDPLGSPRQWVPVFWDRGVPYIIYLQNGKRMTREIPNSAIGMTTGIGLTLIPADAFRSPDRLAMLLLHERQHFDLFGERGAGDAKTQLELEGMVLSRVRANLSKLSDDERVRNELFSVQDDQERTYNTKKAKFGSMLSRLSNNVARNLKGFGVTAPEDLEPGYASEIPSEEALAIIQDADRLNEQLDVEAAQRAREKRRESEHRAPAETSEEMSPIETSPSPNFPTVTPAPARGLATDSAIYSDIKDLAERACSSPEKITQESLDSIWWFPQKAPYPTSFADSLSGCVKELFDAMLDASNRLAWGQKLSAAWLQKKASESMTLPAQGEEPYVEPVGKTPPGYNPCIEPGNTCLKR
ncbi:MAG: hypothetical protein WC969_00005 [Elusimicrobiota bacterium]|jgi:hypothetical protein